MENKRVLVIGGFGYIGREITKTLIEKRYSVSVLSRKLQHINGATSLKGNVLDKELMKNIVKDIDIIIYLAVVGRSFNKSRYKENVIGLKNILEVMHLNKIKKIVYFSTQNIYLKQTGYYGNSKKQCEKIIMNTNLKWVMVRPNYVYGIDKNNDFYRLANIMRKTMLCPIIGDGNYKFQPVHKEDVARISEQLLASKPSSITDISGPDTLSINDVIKEIEKYLGKKVLKIHIPVWLLKCFKPFIPFDIDGFTENRISSMKTKYKPRRSIYADLKHIVDLTK